MSVHERVADGFHSGDALDQCVHASRLIGSDPSLVLHGGGNTSVKAPWTDITGEVIEALYVKGSGWDLGTIERAGFAALPLARLRALLALSTLSDPDMVRELSAARLDPAAPQPSVEALLHAFLPHPTVLHSHADLILSLTNTPDGADVVRELMGAQVVIVPYVMPGFDLARAVAECWDADSHDGTTGIVLLNHGLFTFGDDAEQAYRRHSELIGLAAGYVAAAPAAPAASQGERDVAPACNCGEIASLRRDVSALAGRPMIVTRNTAPATMRFVSRPDLADVATRGPVTPDHVIRTKRVPLVGRDVAAFAGDYRNYFLANENRARVPITMVDPAPRVVLDRQWGMLTVGQRPADALIAADIYQHTMDIIATCEDRLGGWQPLEPHHLFDLEYWDLEQAKLRLAGALPSLAGQVAIVTGAASGIGRGCAAALLARGAAVVGLDRSPGITSTFSGASWLGIQVDVTDPDAQSAAIDAAVDRFGGIDIAVLAAGIFGNGTSIAEMNRDGWRSVMAINLDAATDAMSRLHPLLALSPVGGRVVLIGSKNVHAPGAGAAAYSASKAAITQVARVAAMEWARDGIRINTVHPDAVFDTGLWNDDVLAERAARYGLTVDEYKHRNLLGVEITSEMIGKLVVELCGDAFAATTGAQIPVDGGNERTL
ncbi:MAG: bifunctional aldolase/short-chain dehydrogenase [Ilumatobacteraceae bacterium]